MAVEVVVVEVLPERVEVAGHDVSRLRLGVGLVQLDVEGLITRKIRRGCAG